MDWIAHGVAKNGKRLRDLHFAFPHCVTWINVYVLITYYLAILINLSFMEGFSQSEDFNDGSTSVPRMKRHKIMFTKLLLCLKFQGVPWNVLNGNTYTTAKVACKSKLSICVLWLLITQNSVFYNSIVCTEHAFELTSFREVIKPLRYGLHLTTFTCKFKMNFINPNPNIDSVENLR